MFVMVAYVSLSPARNEKKCGTVDFLGSLGEASYFGKTFGYLYSIFEKNIAVSIDLLKRISPVDDL
jgi:hypothetical protein